MKPMPANRSAIISSLVVQHVRFNRDGTARIEAAWVPDGSVEVFEQASSGHWYRGRVALNPKLALSLDVYLQRFDSGADPTLGSKVEAAE